MNRTFYASSPTVVLPAQQPSQYFVENPNPSPPVFSNLNPFGALPSPSKQFAASQLTPTPGAAGRKRSRADSDLGGHDYFGDGSAPERAPSPPKPKVEPIYGPGMTLIYPDQPGRVLDAGSQTGTWAEERAHAEALEQASSASAGRPRMLSRKSQRLDITAAGPDDVALAAMGTPPKATPIHPITEDPAALALGIGWSSVAENPARQDAARGWQRFIERHFPLSQVTILVESRSLPGYLVSATEDQGSIGFFLFDEALNYARLVARDFQTACQKVMIRPIAYEGAHILKAIKSPIISITQPDFGRSHSIASSHDQDIPAFLKHPNDPVVLPPVQQHLAPQSPPPRYFTSSPFSERAYKMYENQRRNASATPDPMCSAHAMADDSFSNASSDENQVITTIPADDVMHLD